MLLLLLNIDYQEFQLKDLFEIRQGVTMVKQNRTSKKSSGKYHYKVINLSALDTCSRRLVPENLVDYYPGKEINPDKCLSPDDYLITCKGTVKGFSLFFSNELFNKAGDEKPYNGILASNHFFILRPRGIIGGNNSPLPFKEKVFLDNLMDIVAEELNKDVAYGKGSSTKYLTIREVENFVINYPFKDKKKIDEFSVIFDQYYKKLQELNEAKNKLDLFNHELRKLIIQKKQL